MVARKNIGRRDPEEDRGLPGPFPRKPSQQSPSIVELEKALKIDEDDLETSLLDQPESFYRVAKAAAIATSRKDAAYQHIKEVTAEVDRHIRSGIDPEDKMTEKAIESQVRLDRKIRDANIAHLALSEDAAILNALVQAYQMRSYALKDLIAMHLKEYYMNQGSSGDARAEDVRRQQSDRRRERDDRGSGRVGRDRD